MSTAQGVVDVSSLRVRYDVDTYGGASGSPVLGHSDDYVVAIHNLGKGASTNHMKSVYTGDSTNPNLRTTCSVDAP